MQAIGHLRPKRAIYATSSRNSCRKLTSPLHNTEIDVSNQEIRTDNDHRLDLLIQQFNDSNIRASFGYGLGVFAQAGYGKDSQPQIDMVHVVDDPVEFHMVNLARFPHHYSALLQLGFPAMDKVQRAGAGVYFNPYVTMTDGKGNESTIKYGVVSTKDALKDINEWTSLYIAGRLQKPVKHLLDNQELMVANQYNLQSAMNIALLLLEKRFSAQQLYEKIALLSYMGDPRMIVGGENPNKVKNMVSKQLSRFEQLYAPAMESALAKGYMDRSSGEFATKTNIAADIIKQLPIQFQQRLMRSYRSKFRHLLPEGKHETDLPRGYTTTDVKTGDIQGGFLRAVAADRHLRAHLKLTVLETIAYPALVQSVKGLFTAGLVKSAKYAWEKKLKGWRG